jgi:hypothetical protein
MLFRELKQRIMEAVAQTLDRNKKDLSNKTAAINTVSKSQVDERHFKPEGAA